MSLLKVLDSFIMKVEPEWKVLHDVADKRVKQVADIYEKALINLRNSVDVDRLSQEPIPLMADKVNWQAFEDDCDKAYEVLGLVLIDGGNIAAKYLSNKLMTSLSQSVTKRAPISMPTFGGGSPEGLGLTGSFDMRNPRAAAWAATHVGENIRQVNSASRAGINQILTNAQQYGGHPYEIARQIRQFIGLTDRQISGILKYQGKLDEEGRSKAQVDRMVDAQIRRKIRARANTIARTETIAASAAGQQLHWENQMSKGYLNNNEMEKVWIVTPDDRLCPICAAMGDERTAIDGTFAFGGKAPPRHPNCRCAIGLEEKKGMELEGYMDSDKGKDWTKVDLSTEIATLTTTVENKLVTADDYKKGYNVNNYKLMKHGVADDYEKVFEEMTSEQRQAFTYYTKKGTYSRMNRYLRGETPKLSKEDAEALKHMESGFANVKSHMTQDSILYRGLKPTSFKATFGNSIHDIDGILERFSKSGKIGIDDYKILNQSVGKKISDAGYGSATANKTYEKRKLYMEILIDKDDNGVLPLMNLSEFKHESELLMNKNSQYEIVGFKERVMRHEKIKDKNGNWIRNPDLDKKRELVVVVRKIPQT